jgi:transcriptional regulator with GAF, ATPase, and Fis domain
MDSAVLDQGYSDVDVDAHVDSVVLGASSALIGVNGEEVTGVVERVLQSLVEASDVDCATVIESTDESIQPLAVYVWTRPGITGNDAGRSGPRVQDLLQQIPTGESAVVFTRDGVREPRPASPPLTTGSGVVIAVAIGGHHHYTLALESFRAVHSWSRRIVSRLRLLAELVAGALHRARQSQRLRTQAPETRRAPATREPLLERRREPVGPWDDIPIVGNSPRIRSLLMQVRDVAATDSTVLVLGETGTGKELIARAIHARSARSRHPLVSVNCAALPPSLIESELFGHERGAFTGAIAQRRGRFEMAHHGTLFLDEIGDLPLELQAKLLRVLQERTFERLGGTHTQKVDVRIVAATNRDLKSRVEQGLFREDLYYRISVLPLRVPPLRERAEDIPLLVWAIMRRREQAVRRSITYISQHTMTLLQHYPWPGNVRELENVVERALINSNGDTLVLLSEDADMMSRQGSSHEMALSFVERGHIEAVLRDCGGRINGPGNAAERLGLHPNTLRFRMKKLGIVRGAASHSSPAAPRSGCATCQSGMRRGCA